MNPEDYQFTKSKDRIYYSNISKRNVVLSEMAEAISMGARVWSLHREEDITQQVLRSIQNQNETRLTKETGIEHYTYRFTRRKTRGYWSKKTSTHIRIEQMVPEIIHEDAKVFCYKKDAEITNEVLAIWAGMRLHEDLLKIPLEDLVEICREIPLGKSRERVKKQPGPVSENNPAPILETPQWTTKMLRDFYKIRQQDKNRECLRCQIDFKSADFGERLCKKCKDSSYLGLYLVGT